jgi:DNA-binding XRE family transcriptional regulator
MKTVSHQEVRSRRPDTPERRAAIAQQKELILAEIELHALRERRGVTQTALAQALEVSRPRVSRIEHDGEDLRISTMERYVQALGGQLKLTAVFDDGEEIALRT